MTQANPYADEPYVKTYLEQMKRLLLLILLSVVATLCSDFLIFLFLGLSGEHLLYLLTTKVIAWVGIWVMFPPFLSGQ